MVVILCHSKLSAHPCAARQDKNLNITTEQLNQDRATGRFVSVQSTKLSVTISYNNCIVIYSYSLWFVQWP